jgi:hypothetical protein
MLARKPTAGGSPKRASALPSSSIFGAATGVAAFAIASRSRFSSSARVSCSGRAALITIAGSVFAAAATAEGRSDKLGCALGARPRPRATGIARRLGAPKAPMIAACESFGRTGAAAAICARPVVGFESLLRSMDG